MAEQVASIRIANWKEFQHYKERRPPWIKLHRTLLSKREWFELSADASKLLVNLWIVASEYAGGEIPKSSADLAWALRIPDPQLVTKWLNELQDKGFVELTNADAFTMLAERKQSGVTETEERQSTETDSPVRERRPRRGAQLEEDWRPNALHRELAKAKGVDIALEYERFRDHAVSVGRVCKDWDAAFRNWLRKAAEFARNGRPPAGSEASKIFNENPGRGRVGTTQMHRVVSDSGTHFWDEDEKRWRAM